MDTLAQPGRPELLQASDEVIEDAVKYADPMVLRGLIYQLTGDAEITATRTGTALMGMLPLPAVTSEGETALLRRKAAEFLKKYRDEGAGPIGIGPEERLAQSIRLTVGKAISDEDIGYYREELALDPLTRTLAWRAKPDPEQLQAFTVIIIGAGMGGLIAALQLKRAGIPFTVIEKNAGVGGTWYENRYPGARVDVPSRSYTHIVGVDFPFPNPFCAQEENSRYFNWLVDVFDLRKHIVFNTEVRSLTWNESDAQWEIRADAPEGERLLRSRAVITAVGFLNRPSIPDIKGAQEFAGSSWHTARWPENVDLRGKRIAVIGTGATGYQMIPELALQAGHVTVFQRTPQWLFEVPGYRSAFPAQVTWLDRNLPFHTNFMRMRAAVFVVAFTELSDIDPEFEDPHSRNAITAGMREASISFLKRKLGDPKLVATMTPSHPVGSARPILADADCSILDALKRDNVTLVTAGIKQINRTGIEDNSGAQHDVDIIVYATGFHATEYLYPMAITGRNGRTIEAFWAESGARAYRCCMVAGFPNLWSIYGPNSNGALSVPSFHELVTYHALQCMETLILEGKRSIEVKEAPYWRFAEAVDEANHRKVWSDPRAHNYYWTRFNRSATMNPFRSTYMWRLLRKPDFNDLEIR